MTQVLSPTPEALALASQLLHDGQLVAFPTETVYGLGANALDAKAVLNIFAAKGRPADNPLIVHVYDRAQLTPLCEVSPLAEKLMDAFWPGPLTLILPRKPAIPDEVAASLPTVAVRMPSHPVARAVIRAAGVPLAAPSANRSGSPSPTTYRHCIDDLWGLVDAVVESDDCAVGVESTVVSMLGEVPQILRPGAVTPEEIAVSIAGEMIYERALYREAHGGPIVHGCPMK